MAILDGLKNAVAANTARAANNIAVNGLRSLAGDIFGVDLNPTNPAAKLTNRPTKFSTEMLTYPAGVVADDQQGHYIMFEILRQDPAKLKSANKKKAAADLLASNEYQNATRGTGGKSNAKIPQPTAAEKAQKKAVAERDLAEGKKHSGAKHGGQSMGLSKNATVSIDKLIALYMPPSLSVSYNSKYGDQEMGAIAAGGKAVIEAFAGPRSQRATKLDAGAETASKGAQNVALKSIDTVAPGANALVALEKGAIITPRMEMMFEGVGRREFSYEFTFIPKDVDEARTIEKIVKAFKFHMASNYKDGSFREMEIPDLFNITYMYKGKPNTHLNKISTCALEGMDISYGADRFVAYEDGRPQTTKISLKFKEMEIVTKSQIETGH